MRKKRPRCAQRVGCSEGYVGTGSRNRISRVDGAGAGVVVVMVADRVGWWAGRWSLSAMGRLQNQNSVFSMISEAKEICSAAGITAH